ncbi:MAG: BTAD domain-containing putative transcriptional regulator [Streptosporangiaceae bacterium]|jgi:DNA-binding SARP family transcriptional activator/DNA-binding XRE family transcriptional regulator
MYRRESESGAGLADVVRAHRHRAGMTQQELSTRAGLSLAALRDLEQGRHARPRPGSLAALAEALNLDPDETAELASSAAKAQRRRGAASRAPDLEVAGIGMTGSRPGLWVTVLGPLEVWLDGMSLPLGPPGRRAVLGLLAIDPGAVVRRDSVMEVLWGHRAPSTGVSLVQAHVSRLRKLLASGGRQTSAGPEIIASVGGGYRLRLRSEQLDLLTFRALAATAEAARAASDHLLAYERYEQALELWRGEPLADVDMLHDQPAVAEQRRELTEVLLQYAELACGLGFHDRVLPRLHALAAAEPLNERVHARLMIALAGAGQQAAAVRVYEELRGRLDREFAIYPSQELVEAHLRVLRQDLPVVRRSYGQRTSIQVVPRQLPASARYFIGRDREREMLSGLLDRASSEAGEVVVAALTGMAGIGKTALAVNWAHQIADRFPDGQLFVNLLGFSSSGSPLAPGEVLGGFLVALGVPSARIPADTASKAALYRSMLASRRVLIVLDNAWEAEQVRPLLPGSPGSMVLVTSRHRLTGLAAADGAHLLTLGGLTDGESYSLLARVIGPGMVIAERAATGELIARCAGLPLALCNAAARPAARPGLQLATLAAEMRDERGRLDALETGESATSVRVVFSLSNARLSDPAWRMFQMLGMHPGPEITVPAAAALAAIDLTRAQMALAELCDEHLLTEHSPGRYACHELLRAYAAEAAVMHISEADRRAAVYRMLDYYLHTASAASNLLFPILAPRVLDTPRQGVLPELVGDVRQAARWAESERSVLLGIIAQAAEGGYHPHAWELPWAAGWFFSGQECWRELATAQETALEIASGVGDSAGLALAHHHLGWLRFWLGENAEACRHLDGFIELVIRLGLTRDQAARVMPTRAGIPQALVYAGRALRLYRPVDGELNPATWRLSQLAGDRGAIGYRCRILTSVTRLT